MAKIKKLKKNFSLQFKKLRKRKIVLVFIVVLAIALSAVLNALFSQSYIIDCEDYCKTKPHVMCVGYWNISGEYPNCNCQFICWSSKVCNSDYECKADERCYRSYEGEKQVGDLLCHKLCRTSADCPEFMPYCRRVNITIGRSSDIVDMCMREECTKDSDCPQPRCIGMRAICHNGKCRIVDKQGLPARCS